MVFKIISMKSNKGLEYINKYNILKDFDINDLFQIHRICVKGKYFTFLKNNY